MKRKLTLHLNVFVLALALSCGVAVPAPAKRVTSKLKAPKSASTGSHRKLYVYPHNKTEFAKVKDKLTFMAYDKKTGAAKETFFVDNGSDYPLSSIQVEISYFNMSNKLIHKRTIELNQEFPARETRKVDIPSWDTQKSYYYVNSVPSSKGSTPYTVKFRVVSFDRAPL